METAVTTTRTLRKATPVLIVDRVEPVLDFWKKLGITPTVQVPDEAATDGRLAFVILASEGLELMYQTTASVTGDLLKSMSDKAAFSAEPQQVTLYIEVSRLADIEGKLRGERQIMPRRTTFYGATESGYADPAGNVIIFSEHAAAGGG
jgi:hypothetical protein